MSKKADKKAEGKDAKPGGKKKVGIIAVAVLTAFGAWFFLLRSPSAAEVVAGEPEPGEVVALDPITINLSSGHFLRLGVALQVAKGEHLVHAGGDADAEPVETDPATAGAKALDAAIEVFSGKTPAQLTGAGRTKAKALLVKELEERYHHAVMDVYFTEFVMQ